MSAFEGLRMLRRYRELHPDLTYEELSLLVAKVEADASGFDLDSAVELHGLVAAETSWNEGPAFYRACIEATIVTERPIWAKVLTRGRKRLVQNVSRDEAQCFRSAGILDEPPTMEIIHWLDRVTGRVRLDIDAEKLERARQAELLTVEHERARLARLNIAREPKWIAIDDNTVGYDVLSFDSGPVEPISRLIEVKSTIMSPVRFTLTRNEWETACRYGKHYHFHIWHFASDRPSLFERRVEEIAPHIPQDNERGRWRNVEIPL